MSTALDGLSALSVEVYISHSDTPHSVGIFSIPVIGQKQIALPDNTQHSQETGIFISDSIQTRSPRKRAAADPRFRRRGHWNRIAVKYFLPNVESPNTKL